VIQRRKIIAAMAGERIEFPWRPSIEVRPDMEQPEIEVNNCLLYGRDADRVKTCGWTRITYRGGEKKMRILQLNAMMRKTLGETIREAEESRQSAKTRW